MEDKNILNPDLLPQKMVEEEDEFHHRALQQTRHWRRHSSGANRQYSFGRVAPTRRRPQGRHHHGSDARQSRRPGNAAIEHGAGLRTADDRLSRDEFFDGVQLSHLMAERRLSEWAIQTLMRPTRTPQPSDLHAA